MTEYSGFLIKFDEPERASLLQEYVEINYTFSENLSAPDWMPKAVEVCFLCFEGETIHYAALARRKAKSATAKYRIEFSNFVKFGPPIDLDEIKNTVGERYSQYLIRSSSGRGGRIPTKTWSRLIEAVGTLRPNQMIELNDLIELQKGQFERQSGRGFEVMAQEKDATGLALEFAGLDRRHLLSKNFQRTAAPAPFIKGLQQYDVREDSMIFRDMQVFGDWRGLIDAPIGMAIFENNSKLVTIVNANRTPLEETLGVDLIYYHDQFHSYVMVQYKKMERTSQDWVYRPDDQLYEEIERMRAFQVINQDSSEELAIPDYRLHPGLFYLKLCPERIFDAYSSDLIKGMYLPVDYFDLLEKSPEMRGKRNGLRVSWNNTTRFLNNTLFINLVKDGWIGARKVTSDTVTEIIQNSLDGKRSLLLAKGTGLS